MAARDHGLPWVVPGGGPAGPGGSSPTPPPPEGTGRPRLVLTVAGVLAAIALVAATVAFVGGNRGDDRGADAPPSSSTTTDTTEPAPTSTAAPDVPPVSEEEFLALIGRLETYVEQARGLEYEQEVDVELVDDAEFERRLLQDFEDDVEDIEAAEVLYRALGLIGPDENLAEELKAIYTAGVLGFYDPETDELVVRGTTPSPYVQQTIVHELVHALDDQHFELDRPEYDDRKDEIETGFGAVVEGNARRIDTAWLSEQPADVRRQAAEEEQAFGADIDLSDFPEILLFQIGASYSLGEVFISALLADGGEREVDAAIVDPPETSEQFLFPPVFERREPRIEVPPPPADGDLVDDGVVGALFLFGLLNDSSSPVNQADAVRAVEGWGGDWAVTWIDGDQACVRADFVGDTAGDTGEIQATLEDWTAEAGGQVSRVDGRVRLERCDAAAGAVPPQV